MIFLFFALRGPVAPPGRRDHRRRYGAFTVGTTFGEVFAVFNMTAIGEIAFAMAFGVRASLTAGLSPSRKAAQLNPIEALRYG